MYGCYRMSRVVGSDEPLSVARRDAETRRTHQHKPPTCAWRGGRRVQHTGMGRRHPVHRCSRHKLRTEITAERRRRQRSMAGLGRDDAAERETAGDSGRQIHGRSHARMQCESARTVIGSRGEGGGVVSGMQPRAGGAPRDNFPRGLWGGGGTPHSRTGSCGGGGLTGPCTCRARSSRSARRP